MVVWVLFIIALDATQYYVQPDSMHTSMESCSNAREKIIASAPQPKINYDAVCIKTDKVQMQ